MLRRDRRRARKRSAQAINAKRQRGLYATWASMFVALVAILAKTIGASSAFAMTTFVLSIATGVASLVYAHLMWKREHSVLGTELPGVVAPVKRKPKGLHHRAEDTHREHVPRRGATKITAD